VLAAAERLPTKCRLLVEGRSTCLVAWHWRRAMDSGAAVSCAARRERRREGAVLVAQWWWVGGWVLHGPPRMLGIRRNCSGQRALAGIVTIALEQAEAMPYLQ